jgi:hypothetical protein
MWKNIVEPDRPQMTIWRMRILCWIPKPTKNALRICNRPTYCCPLQKLLHERAAMLRYTYIVCVVSTIGMQPTVQTDRVFDCLIHAIYSYVADVLWQIWIRTESRNYLVITFPMPIPVAARSKTWVCCRSVAGTVGSNPAGGHGCLSILSVVCCQVEVSATGRETTEITVKQNNWSSLSHELKYVNPIAFLELNSTVVSVFSTRQSFQVTRSWI